MLEGTSIDRIPLAWHITLMGCPRQIARGKVLHLSFHKGCLRDFEAVAEEPGITWCPSIRGRI
jgi:hypothetical protein